ncbi:hypothetical protein [Maribacter sp.]|uniref:hypothetical protein n=1 Tax=Maribacter sp. TaxID=1897614 RepID=UPI0025BD3765|nr:hypothetical protein [Maribacter sp.]
MNYKNISLSIVLGLAICQGVFAISISKEIKDFDINSIEYVEEEEVISLGFNTADYLPESFDPNTFYFDVNTVDYINDTINDKGDFREHLPVGFDAYAYPTDVQSINYIDANDTIVLDFDTNKYLPKNFNAFAVK